MDRIIITNNRNVRDKYSADFNIEYHDVDLQELIVIVRDYIHQNYKLLTHPLSGSIKPNESKYKSLILEKGNSLDFNSVEVIGKSYLTVRKFSEMKRNKVITKQMDEDYMLIDMSLLEGCLF